MVGLFWQGFGELASLSQLNRLLLVNHEGETSPFDAPQQGIYGIMDASALWEPDMNLKETMTALEDMGTEQNRKIYKRHGAGEPFYGVSFANLKQLKKQIKKDHDLALQLWNTGNIDAQTLACMVADPKQVTVKDADAWIKDVDYYVLAGYVGDLAAQSPHARKLMDKWMTSKKEFVKQAGYTILSSLLRKDATQFSAQECKGFLKTIEDEIHDSPNRARYTMNATVIAIGSWHPDCAKAAIETAKRIGEVDVDHGDTSCKTPDAASYIEKTLAYQKAKAR